MGLPDGLALGFMDAWRWNVTRKTSGGTVMGNEDAVGHAGGQTLYFEWKFPKGDGGRLEGSVSFTLTRSKDSPAAKVLDTKSGKEKKPGAQAASTLSAALLKGDLVSGELIPGLKIKVDATALEAKLQEDAKSPGGYKLDVDIFKVSLTGEGNVVAPDKPGATGGNDLLGLVSAEFSDFLALGYTIKVALKGTIKIDPSDAAKLRRYYQATNAMAANVEEAAKLGKDLQETDRKIKRAEETLRKAQREGKKLKNKAEVDEALRKMREHKRALKGRLEANEKAFKTLAESAEKAAKGLKSKEGKLAAEAVKKFGGKALAKLIPGLNIVSAAADVYEVGRLVYHVANGGELEIGLGGGPEGELGEPPGRFDLSELSEEELEAFVREEIPTLPAPEDPDAAKEKIKLHSTTAAILAALKKKQGKKVPALSPEDIADLNDAIPHDLDSAELDALLDDIAAGKMKPTDDALDLIGQLRGRLDAHRAGAGGAETEPILVEAGERAVDLPDLNPRAAELVRGLRGKEGVIFTPEECARLNELVPPGTSAQEVQALIDHLGRESGTVLSDGGKALEAVRTAVETVRGRGAPAPPPPGENPAPGSKDITDPAKLKAHQEALAAAVDGMKANGWDQIAVLAEARDLAEVKPNDVLDCYFAALSGERTAGGMTKVVVLGVDIPKGKVRIRRQPASLYAPDGRLLGTLPAKESEMSFR
jgi:hypothetical protein